MLPARINVTAEDEFGNISRKYFWLDYDPTKILRVWYPLRLHLQAHLP